jgi:hypothetical protein
LGGEIESLHTIKTALLFLRYAVIPQEIRFIFRCLPYDKNKRATNRYGISSFANI